MVDFVTQVPYYFPDKYTYTSENYSAVYPDFPTDRRDKESADFYS